jgi:hypothetical protein
MTSMTLSTAVLMMLPVNWTKEELQKIKLEKSLLKEIGAIRSFWEVLRLEGQGLLRTCIGLKTNMA